MADHRIKLHHLQCFLDTNHQKDIARDKKPSIEPTRPTPSQDVEMCLVWGGILLMRDALEEINKTLVEAILVGVGPDIRFRLQSKPTQPTGHIAPMELVVNATVVENVERHRRAGKSRWKRRLPARASYAGQ